MSERLLSIDEYESFLGGIHGRDNKIKSATIDGYVEHCLNYHRKTNEPINLKKLAKEYKEKVGIV